MQQFKMNGQSITRSQCYREHFCPQQLLRQKEIAAGFFYHHFRHLSDVCMYHTEMFYLAALMEPREQGIISSSSIQKYYPLSIITPYLSPNAALRKSLLHQHFQEEQQITLLRDLWQLSREAASLSTPDQNRLFCLLVAGYSLAEKTPQECPITPAEAEHAFLNRPDIKTEENWLLIPETEDIPLEARKEPYRILTTADAREQLQAGQCITQRKFVALPHAQSSGVPVTLHLYGNTQDQNPQVVTVDVGDYCYANFVGNVPVWLHPAVAESETCRVERVKRKIIYTNKRTGHIEVLESPLVEPVGFAAEQHDSGWILMYGGNLSDARYSGKNQYFLHKEEIVQVEFRGDLCLFLDTRGTVYTNYGEKYPNQLISLKEFCL